MILKSLFWQIINSIIKILLEIFVFDKKIRRILKGNWAKFYLRKYVCKAVDKPHPLTPSLTEVNPMGLGKRLLMFTILCCRHLRVMNL